MVVSAKYVLRRLSAAVLGAQSTTRHGTTGAFVTAWTQVVRLAIVSYAVVSLLLCYRYRSSSLRNPRPPFYTPFPTPPRPRCSCHAPHRSNVMSITMSRRPLPRPHPHTSLLHTVSLMLILDHCNLARPPPGPCCQENMLTLLKTHASNAGVCIEAYVPWP